MKPKNEIITFIDGNLTLDVNVSPDQDTVWLSANQMALLFNRDEKTIRKHINNIFKEDELDKRNNTQKLRVANVTQLVNFYSLDMIISVGYRVKSKNGIIFRKWATSILKDYIIKGYAINEKRIAALNKTIDIQSRILASTLELDVKEIVDVVETYTQALTLLDEYDHQTITKPTGSVTSYHLSYQECRTLIDDMTFDSNIFGVEKEEGKLSGILDTIYQNVFGQELYPSLEEKAANLLYFIIKDHPFVDGCKRIGASIFLLFLNKNNHLIMNGKQIITNSALVAITLMIAESKPEEKDIMIHLIMNFLKS